MMLIRSQDKLILTEYPCIIRIVDSRKYSGSCFIDTATDGLGMYSSKEKAMKVLDMIEAKYLEPIYINCVAENEYTKYEHKIFQMPADEEVEI